ncbi:MULTISPECIES: PspA/IM30 family protein [Bacillaceae]|uniref:PspA/IM30 family protein n=1 Tax=Evansella alkalicola TaxID=745819 RepID=A0ABS6JWM6_9BACI|nr:MULTISPECIES: PspA/IM30 family protein [Bacillaceae]MBU9722990.1 PspA/IM30 family protein [Bacillus alkalicola]
MSMLQRFKTIMASNVNALLDTSNPAKMVTKHLRELDKDFRQVKMELTTLQTAEQRALRLLNECKAEINKMHQYALKAMETNREDMARSFLEKKASLATKEADLEKQYESAKESTGQLKQMYEKLASDIETLESRRSTLKGKASVASAQKKINEAGVSMYQSMSSLDQMEEEVMRAQFEAEAMAELNGVPLDALEKSSKSVESAPSKPSLEDELAKLREEVKGKDQT